MKASATDQYNIKEFRNHKIYQPGTGHGTQKKTFLNKKM